MAQKKHRGISIEFWTDEKVVSLSPLARLLFIGSWHYCCDEGHLDSTPLELKMRVLPADNCDAAALVEEIVEAGLYVREGGGITVPKLPEHQKIDKRWKVRCERCEDSGDPPEDHPSTTRAPHEDHARSTRGHKGTRDEGEVEGEVKVKGKGGAARGTRLPDIFPITEEMATWGREHAPDVNASREHEKFCDYWRGVAGQRGVKRDWLATWRNWMRRAQDDINPNRKPDDGDDLPDWMRA